MREHETPPTYSVTRPRHSGVAPRGLVGALAGATFLGAVAAAAAGSVAVALLLFVAAGLIAALYFEKTQRLRTRTRGLAGFATGWAGAWARSARDVARLRLEARLLAHRRSRLQHELGGAAFAADGPRVMELRSQMQECVDRIASCAEEERVALQRARRATADEYLAVARTQVRRR
jgi:hypothetical protein